MDEDSGDVCSLSVMLQQLLLILSFSRKKVAGDSGAKKEEEGKLCTNFL